MTTTPGAISAESWEQAFDLVLKEWPHLKAGFELVKLRAREIESTRTPATQDADSGNRLSVEDADKLFRLLQMAEHVAIIHGYTNESVLLWPEHEQGVFADAIKSGKYREGRAILKSAAHHGEVR